MSPRKVKKIKKEHVMLSKDNDTTTEDDVKPDDEWTFDHHLIGNEITCTLFDRSFDNKFYKIQPSLPVQYFQPEDTYTRKPALWRALYPSVTRDTAISFDIISADWQQQQQQTIESDLSNVVKERVQEMVYKKVVQEWIPPLIYAAILEECQASLLTQIIGQQQQQRQVSGNTLSGGMFSSSFLYYQQSPSSYMGNTSFSTQVSDTQMDGSSTLLPVKLTPGQLVSRIKQGCTLLWQKQERQYSSNMTGLFPTTMTRSSRRLLAQQQQQNPTDGEDMEEEINELWKVVPGGKVATYLKENLINHPKRISSSSVNDTNMNTVTTKSDENENHSQADSNNNEAHDDDYVTNEDNDADDDDDDELEDVKDEEMEEENHVQEDMDEVVDEKTIMENNTYLELPPQAILEWLGRKTAKLLSASDLEDAMTEIIHTTSSKPKKQQKLSSLDMYQSAPKMDEKMATMIPAALWNYVCKLDDENADNKDWIDARLSLLSHEELTVDSSQFSRRQFQVKVLWAPTVAKRRMEQIAAHLADVQDEAKNARNWATWRHKGIHTGFTVWSSWLQAVEKWQNELDKKESNGEPAFNKTDLLAGNANTTQPNDDIQIKEKSDEQLAKELEAMTGSRRLRRSEKGGGGGVFYGTQSNMTPKQVMDALLRLVSQSKYQTTASLIAAVPDESSDPLRRIRGAIGKLLWKRNQLSKLEVQTEWTDASVWESLQHTNLITFDNTKAQDIRESIDPDEVTALIDYIRMLHKTELRLRRMLMENLTDVPIAVIATAADEKMGSMESMDAIDFEGANMDSIQWTTTGHELLNKVIFRPFVASYTDSIPACEWFRIVDCSGVVESTQEEDTTAQERSQIGSAKESRTVERRRRFRAESVEGSNSELLILTEGQVLAGLKAAQLENKRKTRDPADPAYQGPRPNPFAGSKYPEITLVAPENSGERNVSGIVASHDSNVGTNGSLQQRILIVPDEGKEFWVTLEFADSGVIMGRMEDDPSRRMYTVQQFEYHTGSQAYEECRSIISFLERHSKAGPFLEPVDPVALNIPSYFSVIKNPMDISTLSANLDSGKYSTIPPNQAKGRSSVARMLNGPFRADVELIFDNAMLFNPPGDWIHQEASALKKAVTRKFDQAINAAENGGRYQQRQSVYSEYESDVDMYEYESDADDEYIATGRSRRKRKQSSSAQTPIKEDPSSRATERPIRLQKILSEQGVRGSLANMPISTDVSTFSLPPGWSCRSRTDADDVNADNLELGNDVKELEEIITLHKAVEEQEASSVRRSTRTHHDEQTHDKGSKGRKLEFYQLESESSTSPNTDLPKNRLQVELECERSHENRFAKLYYKFLKTVNSSEVGMYANGSFPPYLGRVVPTSENFDMSEVGRVQWEIREPYVVPALRWVLRGLIQSEHVHEYEPVETTKDSGTILPNHVYYLDPDQHPLDVVDSKELTRRKRATNAAADESSDDDVELSAYEKMRAERVSRNAERLKALGLA